jgi:cysteine-rich repeat protein
MARMASTKVFVALGLFGLGVAGCSGETLPPNPDPEPGPSWAPIDEHDPIGAAAASALAAVADVDTTVRVLGHRVRQPNVAALHDAPTVESCQAVEDALWTACSSIAGRACWSSATFYWAHDIPRCTARLEVQDLDPASAFSDLWVVDFAGASRVNPAPSCGDGVLDDGSGEGCDDGNLEAFDGCDPNCQPEPFTGCETVIQQEFSAADVAWIDATEWQSPRSHLMVHHDVQPFGAVDAARCARAGTAATAVCERLATEMPFVSWCSPEVHTTGAASCDVRLRVQFLVPAPDSGVFTTALQGVLAFTISD